MNRQRPAPELRRWAESSGGDALEGRLAELFRSVPAPPELGARELAKVNARLCAPARARPARIGHYALLLGIGLLAGTGFALAGYGVRRLVVTLPATPSATAAVSPLAPARRPDVRGIGSPLERLPAPAQSGESAASKEPARSAPSASLAPADSPLARESELLARALTQLRSAGDARGALFALDEYQREFPRGTLLLESQVARLDAFLALGRHADALALLDQLPIDRIGRGAEPRILRAELRARDNPARAIADYDSALAVPLSAALDERALFGRASCRLRAGDRPGAEADLRRYLERHPEGRFRDEASRQLAALRAR
jgi:hypothetical protein